MNKTSGASKSSISERDLSNSTANSTGIHVALILPAVKGKLGWDRVSNKTQFLSRYTPHNKVTVGMSAVYNEVLKLLTRYDSVYLGRPETDGMKFSTLTLVNQKTTESSLSNITGSVVVEADKGYDFSKNPMSFRLWFGANYFTVKLNKDHSTGLASIVTEINTQIAASSLTGKVIASESTGKLKLSATVGNEGALELRVSTFTAETAKSATITTVLGFIDGQTHQGKSLEVSYSNGIDDPESYTFGTNEVTLLHAIDPGVWGDLIEVEIKSDNTYPNTFLLNVHYNENATPAESHLVSRDLNAVDGYGNSLYIEDVLKSSSFIRAVDNVAIEDVSTIEFNSTKINLGGGDDGSSPNDSHFVQLWDRYANTNEYFAKILVDGGHATPANHAKMIEVAERRIDCVALCSDPLSAELSSDYMGEIARYKTSEMVVASSFACMPVGWQYETDEFNNRKVFISPATHKALAIARMAKDYYIWYPSAGPDYGQLNSLDCVRRFEDTELDILDTLKMSPIKWSSDGIYMNGDNSLNPIPSALSNFNNRLALTEIQPVVKKTMDGFLFKFNDEDTRSLVQSVLNSTLGSFKGKKGIQNFKVICDDTNNGPEEFAKNIMNVWILVNFNGIAKYIPITFAISRSGIAFTNVNL